MQTMTKSRIQRRLEKKQAIFLLALVLVVSLFSFVFGIMVGRRGAERDYLAQLKQQQDAVQVVQTPVVRSAPEPESVPAIESEAAPPPAESQSVDPPKLTFYEDLSRDAAPLGSGINRQPQPPVAASEPPLNLPEQPVMVTETAAVTPPTTASTTPVAVTPEPATPIGVEQPEALPAVAKQGTHAVQIGSFAAVKDAAALRQTMLNKGYPAFLAEADLGERGLWYRVRIGPYADSEQAGITQEVLKEKEEIEGFVTRTSP